MPSLSETLVNQNDIPAEAIMTPVKSNMPDPQQTQQPLAYNTYQRCPLPPLWNSNPDSLRQFYVSGVPQYRVYS